MKRTFCLWFPNWPIQRLVVDEPALRKTHLVLFRRDSRKGQLVSAASPLAMQHGVQFEMPISEVKQLLRHSGRTRQTYRPSHRMHPRTQHRQLAKESSIGLRPVKQQSNTLGEGADGKAVQLKASTSTPSPASAAIGIGGTHRHSQRKGEQSGGKDVFYILEHDPIADREALERVVDSLHCFSPIVGIEQTDSPESCFLDVTGLGSLFGDEQTLRAKAIRFLGDAGYTVFSAIASTPGMAWGMAHYHRSAAPVRAPLPQLSPEGEANARTLPGERVEVRGTVCEMLSDETLQREFRKLPVAALRLSFGTQNVFFRLGIERVEQVLAIPRSHLASRFGDEVSLRIDQAFGRVSEPIIARHLPAEFEASQFIEFPTRDRETIGVILSRLLEQICGQLQSNQKGALQWHVQLDCVDAPSIEFEVNLFQPTATVSHVLQLMELQLESVLKPHLRRKRVRKNSKDQKSTRTRTVTRILIQEITVRVTSCVLLVQRQRALFDESPRLDKRELAHLINHLASRLGQESIVYPTLQAGAQPEFSFRFKPLVDPKRMRSRKKANVKTCSHSLARPMRLLDPPVLIAGDPKTGQKQTALPHRFRHQESMHLVASQWGPERIETAWWHGPTIRRDYWRIETETGLHFWIYRDLRSGQWFLQGEF